MSEPGMLTNAAIETDAALGFSISTFTFGAIGCLISWRWAPQMGIIAKLTAMLSAGMLAMFATPILKQTSGVNDQSVLFGAAGLIGVFGLSITASIFDVIKSTKWGSIIEKRLGGSAGAGE